MRRRVEVDPVTLPPPDRAGRYRSATFPLTATLEGEVVDVAVLDRDADTPIPHVASVETGDEVGDRVGAGHTQAVADTGFALPAQVGGVGVARVQRQNLDRRGGATEWPR